MGIQGTHREKGTNNVCEREREREREREKRKRKKTHNKQETMWLIAWVEQEILVTKNHKKCEQLFEDTKSFVNVVPLSWVN